MALTRCISTLGCPELSLDDALALAARHRVPAIEVRAISGSLDLPQYFASHFGSPDRLDEHLRKAPARIVAFNASLRLADGTAAQREELLALLPWADALGVRWLRVFDGGKDLPPSQAIEAAAATVQWWRAVRAERGARVDLIVETHDTLLSAGAIARFAEAAPGTALLWDAHHTWRKGGEDPVLTWRGIAPHVVHVHIKDSIPVPSARHPFTYVLPGDGGFPMTDLAAALRQDQFSGVLSFEWERMWHPYLPPLEEALTAAAARRWW